jgi:hypothetical protein
MLHALYSQYRWIDQDLPYRPRTSEWLAFEQLLLKNPPANEGFMPSSHYPARQLCHSVFTRLV